MFSKLFLIHSVKHNRFMYFHLYYRRYRIQGASEFSYDHRAFIFEFKVQTSCILSQFRELGTGGLVRASASSILREGDWSHVGYLIFFVFKKKTYPQVGSKHSYSTSYILKRKWSYFFRRAQNEKLF